MNDGLYHPALEVPVTPQDHSQGPESAPVTLVLYGDYQCPFTANLHLTITKLQKRSGEHFRYVFRHFPMFTKHARAQLAAETAEAAAAQGKFWEMHAYLFQRQYDFDHDCLAPACALLGLDYVRLDREIAQHVHLEHIQADVAGAKRSGVAGTPALFINGFMYEDNDDFETLSRNIETILPMKNDSPARRSFSLGGLFK